MKFKKVYPCWIFDEIRAGRKIIALNKKLRNVILVNELTVDKAIELQAAAEANPEQYEFWYEKEEEKTNETV